MRLMAGEVNGRGSRRTSVRRAEASAVSGYGRGDDPEPLGRQIDPAWVEWAEEQTVKLLAERRRRQETTLEPDLPAAPAEDQIASTAPAGPAEDPIRLVNAIRLDAPTEVPSDAREAPPAERPGEVTIERTDGRVLVVRVHRENLDLRD